MNMRKLIPFLLVSVAVVFFSSCAAKVLEGEAPIATPAIAESGIAYPVDYRSTFGNYLSLDRVQDPDQIIRLYANDIALQGPDENGLLSFGSVIVGEVYKAKLDENGEVMVSSLGRRLRGDLALVAVMERQETFGADLSEELRNEHWEFAAFKPDGSIATNKDLDSCRACHAPLTDTHHLFSLEHLAQQDG